MCRKTHLECTDTRNIAPNHLYKGGFVSLDNSSLKDGKGRASLSALEATVTASVRLDATAIRTGHQAVGANLFLDELDAGESTLEVSENLREGVEI